jgi:hypothetical protein
MSMASGVVLQMDLAASSYQSLLRHHAERGQDANLDRRLRLRACCHRKKAAQHLGQPISNAINPEPLHVRENAIGSTT